jgi:hypothetical protein
MKNIASALVKAQKAFAPALKTATNPHFRSKYVDLASCVESVIDALNANGIFLFQTTSEHPDGIVCETSFLHESGERLDCGKLFFPAPKQDPQGFMSCLTYIRRASLMAATGQAPEDDDGNAASRGVRTPAAKTELVSPGRTNVVAGVAQAINERMAADDVVGALEEFQGIVDVEEKTALWSMLDSKTRSAIKKQSELSKG